MLKLNFSDTILSNIVRRHETRRKEVKKMRKTIVLIFALMLLVAFAGASYAQPPEGGAGPAVKEGGQKEITPEKFGEFKEMLLKRIDDRIKRLQDERVCVEAAKNNEDLKKCRPARPEGQRGPAGQEGQQRPPKPPMGEPK